ncbi:Nardilysin [Armadillidium vulgare]|nr:Nardilysin [Armadillidium vulgare]
MNDVEFRRATTLPAASLCVGVGHLENPREIQGLMHFLEHMVFMGSEKYPKENAFESFINKCGGCDNARTDYESTNFFFSIEESHFKEALDMFAQFFISPLLKKEAMQRERKAVHSEFQNRVDSDECRKHQILADLANADHPISFFKEGNEKTLQLEISDDELNSKLHDLRRKYYTAQFMTLTVQARETLDVLQDIVIPNNGLEKPTYESLGFPYSKEKFHRLLKIIPVDDEHILELNWVFSPLHKYYESKPLFYIAHFLGHEGYGSLLSYLKRSLYICSQIYSVWAFSLTAGNGENGLDKNSICEMFRVTIHLTDEGLLHVKDIIKYVFEYLNLLKKETIHEGLVLELHKIAQIEFDHSEELNPLGNVVYSSEMMQIYPMKHIITGPSLFLKNDTSI